MSDVVNMKAVFEALLPKGAAWEPIIDGDFDKLLSGIGDNAELMREFLKNLANIRDPKLTPILKDLEKEYGLVTNTQISESDRRNQLAAIKYAKRHKGTFDELQSVLQAAGFDVVIVPNYPAIDPNSVLLNTYAMHAGYDTSLAGYESAPGVMESIACHQGGELIVNGNLYDQEYGYLIAAGSDIAYAGYDTAHAGFFEFESMIKTLIQYVIPSEKATWPRVFFICKAVSQYESLIDWNMEYPGANHWEPGSVTVLTKETFALNDAWMELPETKFWTPINNATLSKVESSLDYSNQALRIAYNGTNTPGATQYPLLPGCQYNIKGYARGDGSINPQIQTPAGNVWTGIPSTDWQYFDVDFTPTSLSNELFFFCGAVSDHWVEFDKITLTNKDARGNRVIQLLKTSGIMGFANANQTFDQIDHTVSVRGLAWSGDGVTVPAIYYIKPDGVWDGLWLGTNSQQKQSFNVNIAVPFIGLALATSASLNAGTVLFDHIEIHDPIFERAQIQTNRKEMLRHLVVKHKPLHSWGLLIADFI